MAKKPSSGLTKKEKSSIAKKAIAGKDIGKKGKAFEKVAAKAAEQYGSALSHRPGRSGGSFRSGRRGGGLACHAR